MRTTTIVALIVVAAAGQALSAASPYRTGSVARPYSKVPIARPPPKVAARDLTSEELLARSFGSDFAQGFKSGFVNTLETVAPLALSFLKREELLARGLTSEELPARSFGSDFVQGFEKGFVGTLETVAPVALSFLRREDLAARASASDIGQDIVGALETVGTTLLGVLRREGGDELLARTLSSLSPEFQHGFFTTLGSEFPVDSFKREKLLARALSGSVKVNAGMKGRSLNELD